MLDDRPRVTMFVTMSGHLLRSGHALADLVLMVIVVVLIIILLGDLDGLPQIHLHLELPLARSSLLPSASITLGSLTYLGVDDFLMAGRINNCLLMILLMKPQRLVPGREYTDGKR